MIDRTLPPDLPPAPPREIRADRRVVRMTEDGPGLAAARQEAANLLDCEIRLARRFLDLWRKRAYTAESCVTLEEYGRRLGLDRRRARALLHVGVALAVDERVEPLLRGGKLTFEGAATSGRVFLRMNGADAKTDWVERAVKAPPTRLEDEARERVAEIEQRTPALRGMTFYLRPELVYSFERAQVVASRRARMMLSREATLEAVLTLYLAEKDPLRSKQGTGTRRLPVFERWPPNRTVSAATRREIRGLYGDRCSVPGCTNGIWLQIAHTVPFREGGSQEVENLGQPCFPHHVLQDAGKLSVIGRTPEGRLVYQTDRGEVLHPDAPASWLPLPAQTRPEAPAPAGGQALSDRSVGPIGSKCEPVDDPDAARHDEIRGTGLVRDRARAHAFGGRRPDARRARASRVP